MISDPLILTVTVRRASQTVHGGGELHGARGETGVGGKKANMSQRGHQARPSNFQPLC
jgi:hypothetical protein